MNTIRIGNRLVGDIHPVFTIGDLGTNYFSNTDEHGLKRGTHIENAKLIIDALAAAGASACKLQTFSAAEHVSPRENLKEFEFVKSLEMPKEWLPILKQYAENKGLVFFSTPFDVKSADLLDKLGVSVFKIPSAEITNTPLVRHIAMKMKPIIMSTAMATIEEVVAAVSVIRKYHTQIILLQCTASYPSKTAYANLRAMDTLRQLCPIVGFSDHSLDVWLPSIAVARDAKVIEAHICVSRGQGSPDAPASLNPTEFRTMVDNVRWAERCIGSGRKEMQSVERRYAEAARKSVYVGAVDLKAGELITADALKVLRPPKGMEPKYFDSVVGRRARTNIPALSPLYERDLE